MTRPLIPLALSCAAASCDGRHQLQGHARTASAVGELLYAKVSVDSQAHEADPAGAGTGDLGREETARMSLLMLADEESDLDDATLWGICGAARS